MSNVSFFFKMICLTIFYIACNLFGFCHRYLTDAHQETTYQNTMRCIEARLRLEREKEQQETLILSVIPAHIGRKNTIFFIFFPTVDLV